MGRGSSPCASPVRATAFLAHCIYQRLGLAGWQLTHGHHFLSWDRSVFVTAISLEAHSNHLTAQALQRLAAEVGIPARPVSGFQEVPGKGVLAMLDGKRVLVGRPVWVESVPQCSSQHCF